MDSVSRIENLRRRLANEQAAAFAASHMPNVVYLTGFDGVFDDERGHVALVTADKCVLFTNSLYAQAAREAADKGGGVWRVEVVSGHTMWEAVEGALGAEGVLAVEDSMPHSAYLHVKERFTERVAAVHDWVEEIRAVKSVEEIARMEGAQALTDAAFMHVLGILRPGVAEREIAIELEFFMRREGSDGVAFPPIVASGPNSALPHAHVTGRAVEPGDFVTMDFGARLDGYCADMTRTVVVGTASARQREVYEAVLGAHLAGIEAVRPELPGKQIDAAARAVIDRAGLGEYFVHGLGHGVGLEVHELPGVGPKSLAAVPLGSVITIEPGVYIEGFGGVRIEDSVIVEKEGARALPCSPKTLIEL